MYYYFWKNKKILETRTPLPTQFNPSVVELTPEQVEFYLANPTATIQEVMNCELTPPYVPPTPDVQEYAAEKVKELKEVCYSSVNVTTLEFAMAIDKVENPTAICYYGLADAQRVVSDFRTQSKKAMQTFNNYSVQITEASTIEDIDTIYNQAIEAL